MTAFLLRRLGYLTVLVVVATVVAYFLAATQLNPRSRYEGRNPPPPPAAVDAILDELNLNDKTPVIDRFTRWAGGLVHGDLGRPPSDPDRAHCREAIHALASTHGVAEADLLASRAVWKDAAHMMFNLKEFIFIP